MEFRTKREAEGRIAEHETRSAWCEHAKTTLRDGCALREQRLSEAKRYRAEAARIRALLPTLPE